MLLLDHLTYVRAYANQMHLPSDFYFYFQTPERSVDMKQHPNSVANTLQGSPVNTPTMKIKVDDRGMPITTDHTGRDKKLIFDNESYLERNDLERMEVMARTEIEKKR